MVEYVAYYRVSTQKQGINGLGIEAQKTAVESYLKGRNSEADIVSFTEVESGTNKDRPQLQKALRYCRDNGAKLIIAKLDRLSRSVHFITGLIDSKVDFVACDLPDANKLTIHIMAAVAEAERDAISDRTKAAYREHEKKGCHTWGRVSNDSLRARGVRKSHYLYYMQEQLNTIYFDKPEHIIEELNNRGLTTRTGKEFNKDSYYRMLRDIRKNEKKLLYRGQRRAS